jgi:hypothetical protein
MRAERLRLPRDEVSVDFVHMTLIVERMLEAFFSSRP